MTTKILTSSDAEWFPKLLQMASEVYRREKDSEAWLQWKYFASPFGSAIVIVAMDEQENLLGECTYGRFEFEHNGKVLKALYTYQILTHPGHRQKGVFRFMHEVLFDQAKKEEIDVVFNFPNATSYVPFLKIGFHAVNHIRHYIYVNPFMVVTGRALFKRDYRFIPRKICVVNKVDKQMFETNFSDYQTIYQKGFIPRYTQNFMRWRYFQFPVNEYAVIKTDKIFGIVRTGTRMGFPEVQIMELFQSTEVTASDLRQWLNALKKRFNPAFITLNCAANYPWIRLFRKNHFFPIPTKIRFCVYPLKDNSELTNPENWNISATLFHRY